MKELWVKIKASFNNVGDQLAETLPNIVSALLILILGWIIAKLVSKIISNALRRVGLDKLGERMNQMDAFRDSNIRIRPVKIIEKFIYWTLLLVFTLIATEILGIDLLTQQVSNLIQYIPNLLTALVILGLGFFMADALKRMVGNAAQSFGVPAWRFLSGMVFILVFLVVAVTALEKAGIDTHMISSNANIILGGIVLAFALAYGFAARNILRSILAGFYSRSNFREGQLIELDGYKGSIYAMDKVTFTLDLGEQFVVFPMDRLVEGKVLIHEDKNSAD